jgi:hypothetical protein
MSHCGAIVVPGACPSTRAGETVARSDQRIWESGTGGACPSRGGGRHVPGTHTAVPILISKSGATVKRRKRRNALGIDA